MDIFNSSFFSSLKKGYNGYKLNANFRMSPFSFQSASVPVFAYN